MAGIVKSTREKVTSCTDLVADSSPREISFYASFAVCISVDENYQAVVANIPLYEPTHSYRLSYILLPTESPTIIDVALFGAVAKIFCKDQTLCLKVYHEHRGQVWIAWSKKHTFNATNESLTKLFAHTCQVLVGEPSENVKYNRPKGFQVTDAFYESVQFLHTYSEHTTNTASETLVTSPSLHAQPQIYSDIWEKLSQLSVKSVDVNVVPPWQEVAEMKESRSNITSSETSKENLHISEESIKSGDRENIMCDLEPVTKINYKVLHDYIITKKTNLVHSEYYHTMGDSNSAREQPFLVKKSANIFPGKPTKFTQEKKKKASKRAPEVNVLPVIQMKMKAFFMGLTTQVIENDHVKGPASITKVTLVVSIEDELMSSNQKIVFNPLTVKLSCVEDLPPIPMSGPVSQTVYLKYQIQNYKSRQTNRKQHNTKKVIWNDTFVFLMGIMSTVRLREFFSGPPLMVEIHDRDNESMIEDMPSAEPLIFGQDPLDKHVMSSVIAEHHMHRQGPYDLDQPLSMFGVAKLNLSQFLTGKTEIDFCEQVMCSETQKRRQSNAPKYVKEQFDPDDIYLGAGTSLEAHLKLCFPLFNPTLATNEQLKSLPDCCFARIVIKFSNSQTTFLFKLLNAIAEINAEQLVKNKSHSSYCLGSTLPLQHLIDRSCLPIDILTGVHIFDKNCHVFYLEGQMRGSMQTLLAQITNAINPSQIKFLYNSAIIFQERLYILLPNSFCHLCLFLPVRKILAKMHRYKFTSSFIRDQCLKALQNIQQLSYCKSLEEVTRNELFPTRKMILALSQHAGHIVKSEQIANLLNPIGFPKRAC